MTTPAESESDRLRNLHLALEAALEQVGYAQEIATRGSEIGHPSEDVQAIERLAGELLIVRNGVRDRLMKLLARPTLNILK